MSEQMNWTSPKQQVLKAVPGLQWLVCSIFLNWSKDNLWTGDRVMGARGSLMCLGSESQPAWSMIYVDVTLTLTTDLNMVEDQVHPFMETAAMAVPLYWGWSSSPSGTVWGASQRVQCVDLPPNSPYLNPTDQLWNVLDKLVQSMEAKPQSLQDLQDLLHLQRSCGVQTSISRSEHDGGQQSISHVTDWCRHACKSYGTLDSIYYKYFSSLAIQHRSLHKTFHIILVISS